MAGGWCCYSDIPISIKSLYGQGKIKKAMIIDLDAHQGNGHERDKIEGKITKNIEDVYIFDIYNKNIYPGDTYAKKGINIDVGITRKYKDTDYLDATQKGLDVAFKEFKPDIVYYNAGTDILETDPLGNLSITAKAVAKRDELVFKKCLENKVPIVMVLSGGYAKENAKVISDSIENLFKSCDLIKVANENYQNNIHIQEKKDKVSIFSKEFKKK